MKVLVAGGRGMLGTDLVARLRKEDAHAVLAADLPEIDITSPESVDAYLDETTPEVVVNCAAWTDVDGAEAHPQEAFKVNAEGAGNVAASCEKRRIRLVHLSTDFVFDGTKKTPYVEDDEPNPLSVYGESKFTGERLVIEAARSSLIVRTSWLYGLNGKNFIHSILRIAREGKPLRVVADQYGSPTWTVDLAGAIAALIDAKTHGIVHAVGAGICTWCDFAREILNLAHIEVPVTAIATGELSRPARRPAYSALDTTKLRTLTGFTLPDWRASLKRFMETLARTDRT